MAIAQDKLIKLYDSNTGELVSYQVVDTWYDGTPMDDTKVDGVIYRKKGSNYYKRNFTGPVNVKWFGAKGDGVTDDGDPINEAMRVVSLLKGTLLLEKGIYLLNHIQTGGTNSTLLIPRSNLTLIGEGDESILFQGNNLKTHVMYPLNSTSDERVDNATYKNFKIDCNGENNLIISGQNYSNIGIGARYGDNIVVDGITVVNNAGRQCFSFGGNVKPQAITNISITNCKASVVGGAVPGNINQNDHSVIYVQADNAYVGNNTFENPLYADHMVETGIECHSMNAVVENNIIRNFGTGVNVVATVTDHINVIYSNNTFMNVNVGAMIWTRTGMIMKNINIVDNYFLQYTTLNDSIIDGQHQNLNTIDSMTIQGNTIISTKSNDGNSSGVLMGNAKLLTIKDNEFSDIVGRPISCGSIGTDCKFIIENNTFSNNNSTTDTSYKSTFRVTGTSSENISYLSFKGNKIFNQNLDTNEGIYISTPVLAANIENNFIANTIATHINLTSTASTNIQVNHSGVGTPLSKVIASFGSKYTDTITGYQYIKKNVETDNTGWRLETYLDALPVSGVFRQGDIIYKKTPVATTVNVAGFMGWIALATGSVPNWTPFSKISLGTGNPSVGSTANRPSSPYTGDSYWDTTLAKIIYWNGTGWVDSTGTTV